MSESVQIAAFLLIAGALAALFSMLIGHINHCREVQRVLGELAAAVKRIETEVGTHETGIRGQIHQIRGLITPVLLDYQQRHEKR